MSEQEKYLEGVSQGLRPCHWCRRLIEGGEPAVHVVRGEQSLTSWLLRNGRVEWAFHAECFDRLRFASFVDSFDGEESET